MTVKMINKVVGIADPKGVTTRVYEYDEIIPDKEEWQKELGERFVKAGHAVHINAEINIPNTKDSDVPSDAKASEKPKAKTKKSKKTFWSKK